MNGIGQDVWIGVDLGTQSVRVMAVGDDGEVLGAATRPLTSRRDGVRHEQDPREWWTATCEASREALAGVSGKTMAVAVCGTSGTVLTVDPSGAPLTPALMYDDGRATAELDEVNGVGETLWSKLGYLKMQAVWGLPKLLWLARNEGFPPGARLAHQADVINEGLAGHPVATDLSNALKSGCDTVDENWPTGVLDALGIGHALPPIVRSGTVIANVGRAAAEATGIAEGTPIVAGMTDGCASQLSSGATRTGSWNTVLGTTLVLKGSAAELVRDPSGVVYSHRSPAGGWFPGGASSTGAGALTHYLPGADLDGLSRRVPARPDDFAIAYPLVSDAGERFPFVQPAARGFFPRQPSDPVTVYAQLTRGVAAIERLCFDYLHLIGAPIDGDVRFTGGGSRSGYWNRLRATMLTREVLVPSTAEPAFGMAVLAASSRRGLVSATENMISIGQRIEPEQTATAQAMDAYVDFVGELESRGWLPSAIAVHAKERAHQ